MVNIFSIRKFLYCGISLIFFVTGCNNESYKEYSTNKEPKGVKPLGSGDIYYKSLFGEKYVTQGGFLKNAKDYTETNLWMYTNQDRPLVLFGYYSNGMLKGEWNFILSNGTQMSSQWNVYKSGITPCAFSIPFQYEEQYVDSFSVKLRTMNDSLGKIGIMVQIRDTTLDEEGLKRFGGRPNKELQEQGYILKSNKREIEKDKNNYFFYEYFLKDSVNKEAKIYYFFGNTPSRKHFVLFTLYHQGPGEDLVKIICNLIATSLYVHGERFYNPYERSEPK